MNQDKLHFVTPTAIIIKDGKFLIAKRSENEEVFPGRWTVPGGRLEKKDYIDSPRNDAGLWYHVIEEVLRREVKEEVGLEIDNIQYLTSITHVRDSGEASVFLSFFCNHKDGEVVLSDELIDYAWVTLEEAKEYDLIEGIYDELIWTNERLKLN